MKILIFRFCHSNPFDETLDFSHALASIHQHEVCYLRVKDQGISQTKAITKSGRNQYSNSNLYLDYLDLGLGNLQYCNDFENYINPALLNVLLNKYKKVIQLKLSEFINN